MDKMIRSRTWFNRAGPGLQSFAEFPFHRLFRAGSDLGLGTGGRLYDQWMLEGTHETTAAGNPKPPPPELYLEWVLEAWYDGVTDDKVINSFKACGIGAIGGADDYLIQRLKEGNAIPNGLYELTKAVKLRKRRN
ncbi:pogo transposable element with KRAB domain-like protein [Aphelenchoides avenae]|nr:pogo transposable element with KRAB domain-like protein [Aphelenchus avenae]